MTEKISVYCNHVWDSFGANTMRCHICRTIWKKFKDPEPPKVVIGYIEDTKAK